MLGYGSIAHQCGNNWSVTKLPRVNQRNKYKKDVNQGDSEECDAIIVLISVCAKQD